jgi:hypothetical protein
MGNLEVEYIGFGLRFHRRLGIIEFLLSSSPASISTLRENLEEYYAKLRSRSEFVSNFLSTDTCIDFEKNITK